MLRSLDQVLHQPHRRCDAVAVRCVLGPHSMLTAATVLLLLHVLHCMALCIHCIPLYYSCTMYVYRGVAAAVVLHGEVDMMSGNLLFRSEVLMYTSSGDLVT